MFAAALSLVATSRLQKSEVLTEVLTMEANREEYMTPASIDLDRNLWMYDKK